MECSHQMWNRPSQCHLLYMLNSLRDQRAPIWGFFSVFFFASSRFFQEPAHKEDKNRVILNKIKQTGKAEVYIWEKKLKRLKNSPDKNHTKHSSHLISCSMHWGNWEHQAPRQQCSGSLLCDRFMHTHPHIPLTQAEVHMHAQAAREPQWGMKERGGGGWSRIWYQLGTQRTLPLQAKQESKLKQRQNTG